MSTLRVEQVVDTDRARVWAAWTTADGLRAWWWPQLPDTTYAVDARVGGSYRIWSEQAAIGVHGELERVDEPRELGFTWRWLDGGAELPADAVTVAFTDLGDGTTQVVVSHEMGDADGGPQAYRQGWTDVLARLGALAKPTPEGR